MRASFVTIRDDGRGQYEVVEKSFRAHNFSQEQGERAFSERILASGLTKAEAEAQGKDMDAAARPYVPENTNIITTISYGNLRYRVAELNVEGGIVEESGNLEKTAARLEAARQAQSKHLPVVFSYPY